MSTVQLFGSQYVEYILDVWPNVWTYYVFVWAVVSFNAARCCVGRVVAGCRRTISSISRRVTTPQISSRRCHSGRTTHDPFRPNSTHRTFYSNGHGLPPSRRVNPCSVLRVKTHYHNRQMRKTRPVFVSLDGATTGTGHTWNRRKTAMSWYLGRCCCHTGIYQNSARSCRMMEWDVPNCKCRARHCNKAQFAYEAAALTCVHDTVTPVGILTRVDGRSATSTLETPFEGCSTTLHACRCSNILPGYMYLNTRTLAGAGFAAISGQRLFLSKAPYFHFASKVSGTTRPPASALGEIW